MKFIRRQMGTFCNRSMVSLVFWFSGFTLLFVVAARDATFWAVRFVGLVAASGGDVRTRCRHGGTDQAHGRDGLYQLLQR